MKRQHLILVLLGASLAVAPAVAQPGPFEWEDGGAVAVGFLYKPEIPKPGESTAFIAVFKGTPVPGTIVTWYFPGAEPVVGNPVEHIFKIEGKHPVEVTVTQPHAKTLTDAQVVEVVPPDEGRDDWPWPVGASDVWFEPMSKILAAGEPISFIASFKGTPTEDAVLTWTFARGELRYGNPVQYTFGSSRKWLVTVTLEQPGFKTLSYSAYVPVGPGKIKTRGL